jgi:hypothetical protein
VRSDTWFHATIAKDRNGENSQGSRGSVTDAKQRPSQPEGWRPHAKSLQQFSLRPSAFRLLYSHSPQRLCATAGDLQPLLRGLCGLCVRSELQFHATIAKDRNGENSQGSRGSATDATQRPGPPKGWRPHSKSLHQFSLRPSAFRLLHSLSPQRLCATAEDLLMQRMRSNGQSSQSGRQVKG